MINNYKVSEWLNGMEMYILINFRVLPPGSCTLAQLFALDPDIDPDCNLFSSLGLQTLCCPMTGPGASITMEMRMSSTSKDQI